jgi:hypothetical protein
MWSSQKGRRAACGEEVTPRLGWRKTTRSEAAAAYGIIGSLAAVSVIRPQ